jgi:predicted esterase
MKEKGTNMNEINKGNITTPVTGRYYTAGKLTESTNSIWLVCHGYGGLAKPFLQSFQPLDQEDTFIIAPEALHRFYIKGVSGKVGASWMTKEDRLNDIQDYVAYLDNLYKSLLYRAPQQSTINVLGFSQGAATVSRWLSSGNCTADHLILWAGLFPPDLDFEVDRKIFQQLKVFLVYGTEDAYIDPMDIHEQEDVLQDNDIPYETISFEGGHKISKTTLQQVIDKL